jgi:multidrug transporter EmrE-like cation transporter
LSIALVLCAAILGAVGQFVFQHAAKVSKGGVLAVLLNPWAIGGMLCYVSVMVMFTNAFRAGGAVKVLYPIYASTFIWAAIMAATFQHQPIRIVHGVVMVLLLAGIACMSW